MPLEPGAAISGLAIDFGGTKIAGARVIAGVVQSRAIRQTKGDAEVDAQLDAILDLLAGLDIHAYDRVGVAVAGRVDALGNWYAVNRQTLSRIDQVPLREMLAARLDREVRVQNDAIAAAIGEQRFGAGRGSDAFAYVTISTGVGGGIVLQGRPLISPSGLACHLGFTTSRAGSRLCGSGRLGTIESVASGRAMSRMAGERGHHGHDAIAIFAAAGAGETWANELIDLSAVAIAELCANLKAMLDIERVAIGGGVGLADGYLARVQHALDLEPELFRPQIVPAALGSDAPLIGVLA